MTFWDRGDVSPCLSIFIRVTAAQGGGREAFVGTWAVSSWASSHLRSLHVTSVVMSEGWEGLHRHLLFSLDGAREQISFRNFQEFELTSPRMGPEYTFPNFYHTRLKKVPSAVYENLWNLWNAVEMPLRASGMSAQKLGMWLLPMHVCLSPQRSRPCCAEAWAPLSSSGFLV